jgi:hypothetical protein
MDGDSNCSEIVDMGADEFYWSPVDFDHNEIVNFLDYALFANGWQTGDANYSLDGDNDVDNNDLRIFCKDWLWQFGMTRSMAQSMAGGLDYKAIYQAEPAEQQTIEAEQIEAEEPDIEEMQIFIDWLEWWLTDEATKELVLWQEGEEGWQKFTKMIEEWIEELKAQIQE